MRIAFVTVALFATAASTRGGCGNGSSGSGLSYQPCAGKACGAECDYNPPCLNLDPPCEIASYVGQCDPDGVCQPPGTPNVCGAMPICDGKACGDPCNPCAPVECMGPAAYACDQNHQCVPSSPDLCARLSWYDTCGDPVCGIAGWRPDSNIPLCTTQKAGDPCTTIGEQCDLKNDCNVNLVCATSDPTIQVISTDPYFYTYMCPISRAKYKTDIQYLDGRQIDRLRDELLKIKLASYRYRASGPGAPTQLGFIIDDVGPGPSVNADGETVNLYGYTSMAVAALQAQQRELVELRQEVASLRRQIDVEAKRRRARCR